MKKRIGVIGVLLILIITLLCMTVSADETETTETRAVSGQWTYTISNGNATITAYSGTATSITIPNTLDGYRVTGIGASVFADRTTLSSISFTSNLESIGSEAFRNCTSLSTITLPVNLTSIGYHAFYNCTNLSSITIYSKNLSDLIYDSCFYNAGKYVANGITVTFGNEVTRIPKYLFECDQNYYARIKSVKMGASITYIADSAFENCFDLSSVTWGSGLVTIGSDAFNNCTSLSSVTLPESLETLGYHAFYNCTGLSSVTINAKKLNDLSYDSCFYNAGKNVTNGIAVTFGNEVTRIPRYLFKCDQNYYARIKSVKMGSAITYIAESVFVNCLDLDNVTWGSGLVSIESDAFNNCTSLPSVVLPESLETLGYHAFYNCTGLSSVTINAKQLNDLSSDSCFYNAGKNSANGITVTFGNAVTRIPRYLFNCDQNYYARIKSVKMGSAVTLVAGGAFENCLDLSSVTWGSNLVTVSDAAFKSCTSLPIVSLPAALETISSEAFMNCSRLTTVTLPVSLTTMGYHAFYNDTALTSITINSKKLNDFSYDSCFYNAGKHAANGITVTFGNEVTRIPRYLFKCDQNYYARIKSVKMGSAITYIANSAFVNCFDLSSVTWGSGLVTIGSDAFNNCTSLSSVTLPESLETLGYHAFYNCTGLSSVTINAKKLNDLGYDSCFYNAGKNVTNGIAVTFGNEVTRIPRYLFKCDQNHYARIKSVKMGSAVTLVAGGAFENCLDLSRVTWGNNLVTVSDAAFKNCQSISTISLPASVAEVGYQAFRSCKNLIRLDVNNPKCTLYGNKDTLGVPGTAVIYGYRNSTAQTYATKYGYSFVALDTTPQPLPFTDVPSGTYYYDAVRWAVENNVTSGTSATTFSPDEGCTRAQVVTFLWRAAGKPDPASSKSPFSDVKEGAYYYNAVLWAVEKGITNGTSDKTFSPDETCTRAQIVAFLWRYEEQPVPTGTSNPFADVRTSAYFGSAVLWAVETGITNGTSATTFDPEDTCTRAQVVTFLYRDIVKS